MFKVARYQSPDHQKWLISLIETLRFDESVLLFDKFIPRPTASIIFHFKEAPFLIDSETIGLNSLFLAPVIPKALVIKFQGNMDTFVASCKPTVLSRLFNIDMTPAPPRSIHLPEKIFQPIWVELKELESDEARMEHFNNFVSSLSPSGGYLPDAIDILYNKIIEKSIRTPLRIIMNECDASFRTLQRHFVERCGVTPKTLMRIVRLNYLWTKIKYDSAVDYQDLVFNGNYFDQSHFINDFKYIVGETPNQFFNRNLEIVEYFSGKSDYHDVEWKG
jgi:AraC-like DNA-binding protein